MKTNLFPTNKILQFPNTPQAKLLELNKQIKKIKEHKYDQWMIRQNKIKPSLSIVK
jgi:hypothetical protein